MLSLDWQLRVRGFAVLSAGNGDKHSQMQMSFILREQIASLLSLYNSRFVILWLLGQLPWLIYAEETTR